MPCNRRPGRPQGVGPHAAGAAQQQAKAAPGRPAPPAISITVRIDGEKGDSGVEPLQHGSGFVADDADAGAGPQPGRMDGAARGNNRLSAHTGEGDSERLARELGDAVGRVRALVVDTEERRTGDRELEALRRELLAARVTEENLAEQVRASKLAEQAIESKLLWNIRYVFRIHLA